MNLYKNIAMKIKNTQLNWQFALLVVLILGYGIFCTCDFVIDMQKQEQLRQYQKMGLTMTDYLKLHGDSFSFLLAEWLLGIATSLLALFLVFKGQKSLAREAEQKVKIHLLNRHINKLNNQEDYSRKFFGKIESQFKAWRLTKSESEIALLLLKGLAFKEMEAVRGSSEKTIRQQASTIYSKASLKGRNEFSAFFFEEILMADFDNPIS